jgi:outer membrane protein assembly factor BamA
MQLSKNFGQIFFLVSIGSMLAFSTGAFCQSEGRSAKPAATYPLKISIAGKDNSFDLQALQLQTLFSGQVQCFQYINKLVSLLASKGYPSASVDSLWFSDSATFIRLYLGKQYFWADIKPIAIDQKALDESGFSEKNYTNQPIKILQLQQVQQRILNYYENNGYPFAEVYLDSVQLDGDKINAQLRIKKSVLYHLDSLRVYGNVKISRKFLYHFLHLAPGALYSKEMLQQVDKHMDQLPYLQQVNQSNITMLGSGSILNLFLAPRRSSQADVLVGLLPGDGITNKFQLTGDVKLNLQNALGKGESIIVNWQQLQRNSPRINLAFQQPYIFNSSFGADLLFNLFKKDSSFLQINAQVGVQYISTLDQSGKVFIQWQNNILLANGVDTNLVKLTRQLPANIDVNATSLGIEYEWSKTNNRFNPGIGNEIKINAVAGLKKIKQNFDIINLKDPNFNYASLYDSVQNNAYQIRIKFSGAHYFPIAKQATIKAALNIGSYFSRYIFRNELFQIGGYKILRGFNEESIYATQYVSATLEYRLLLGLRSYLFGFSDGAWVKNRYQKYNVTNNFLSAGLGIAFETKNGLLNVSYATGKRNDVPFNIREASKIHFGFVNYF